MRSEGVPPFFLIDDPDRLARAGRRARLARRRCAPIDDPPKRRRGLRRGAAGAAGRLRGPRRGRPARIPANAPAILGAIETAVAHVRSGRAAGGGDQSDPQGRASTAPASAIPATPNISPNSPEPARRPVMMLACPELRVVPVTIHLALRRGVASLSPARDRRTPAASPRGACAAISASPRRGSPWPASTRMPARTARSAARRSRSIAPAVAAAARRRHRRARAACRPTRCSTPRRARPTTRRCACITTRR